jgi:hypothetical protein
MGGEACAPSGRQRPGHTAAAAIPSEAREVVRFGEENRRCGETLGGEALEILLHVISHLCWAQKKPGEPGFSSIQWVCLVKRTDICCLLPFRATRDVEGNLLAFCERLEALSLNSGEMGEHVFAAAIRGNETKAFRAVEPFNGTNCHV